LRDDSVSYRNVLIGNWKLNEIKCYDTNYLTGFPLERYIISTSVKVEMIFSARAFRYNVNGTTTSTCITSATGSYSLNFNFQNQGTINYDSINSSSGCTLDMLEAVSGETIAMPMAFSPLVESTDNLFWAIDDQSNLVVQNSTGFVGSEDIPTSSCSGMCTCYGVFTQF
jgi:hypothetical protein